ncbi:MAG: family acetyltransferase [Sporolactobacillus laevolacticus]|jgi:predicted acetyltransferase|nr:family acetyltransferase [Sporolactobacillus laevolacticus]
MYQLVEPTLDLENNFLDYISEWEQEGDKIVPSATNRCGKAFNELIREWSINKTNAPYKKGFVPASLYFLINEHKKIFGAIQVRHELNDFLLDYGGHIGYGIRPSERRKGLATKMLSMALEKARVLGIRRALITCDKNNRGSDQTT